MKVTCIYKDDDQKQHPLSGEFSDTDSIEQLWNKKKIETQINDLIEDRQSTLGINLFSVFYRDQMGLHQIKDGNYQTSLNKVVPDFTERKNIEVVFTSWIRQDNTFIISQYNAQNKEKNTITDSGDQKMSEVYKHYWKHLGMDNLSSFINDIRFFMNNNFIPKNQHDKNIQYFFDNPPKKDQANIIGQESNGKKNFDFEIKLQQQRKKENQYINEMETGKSYPYSLCKVINKEEAIRLAKYLSNKNQFKNENFKVQPHQVQGKFLTMGPTKDSMPIVMPLSFLNNHQAIQRHMSVRYGQKKEFLGGLMGIGSFIGNAVNIVSNILGKKELMRIQSMQRAVNFNISQKHFERYDKEGIFDTIGSIWSKAIGTVKSVVNGTERALMKVKGVVDQIPQISNNSQGIRMGSKNTSSLSTEFGYGLNAATDLSNGKEAYFTGQAAKEPIYFDQTESIQKIQAPIRKYYYTLQIAANGQPAIFFNSQSKYLNKEFQKNENSKTLGQMLINC